MTQTKLRGRRPFGSPTADDDVQGLYHFGYWCEFPTHLHRKVRLTSEWNSGGDSDFGLLEWPGLLLDVNFYIWDGRLIRWWAEHPERDGVFRLYRRCDLATWRYWYFFQHWSDGILDGAWEFNHVAPDTHPEKGNHDRKIVAQIFNVPSDPFNDWAMQIEWWGVLPGHEYPPPASDPRWEPYH
jgi:hypothetical protein